MNQHVPLSKSLFYIVPFVLLLIINMSIFYYTPIGSQPMIFTIEGIGFGVLIGAALWFLDKKINKVQPEEAYIKRD